jgi:hypothetical protein
MLGACAGSVAVEMALVAPVLLGLLLGIADVGWYALMSHRMSRVAATAADLTARGDSISEGQIQDIFAATLIVARPFDLADQGRTIVSSLTNPEGAGPTIAWQRRSPSGLDMASRLGAVGGSPSLPLNFTLNADENIVVAECFFRFDPLVGFILRSQQSVYVRAFQRPRLGTLDRVNP